MFKLYVSEWAVLARRIGSFALLCILFLSGCADAFAAEYLSANKGKAGRPLYEELVRLDQAYPNRLRLKIDLGAMLLSRDDLQGAKAYLDSGEKLLGPFADPRSSYVLYADQAALKLRGGACKEAVTYATKAISASAVDELGVVFTKAKAELSLKDRAAALKDYDKGWSACRSSMSAEDYSSYAEALMGAGRYADAILAMSEFQKAFPYYPGIGLLESECYERVSDESSAILCAYKEYEFQRSFANSSHKAVFEVPDSALEKRGAASSGAQKSAERLVASLKAFSAGDWKAVVGVPCHGFGEYVVLAAKLESGPASAADLERYILLEPYLKSFQSYYGHLWHVLKKDERSYSAKAARPLLEKCVALAPASSLALEARGELGRLAGIGKAAGEKLLVPAEIDAIFTDILAGAPFSRLDPVLALLETPDNDYQLNCVCALGKISADPGLRAYLSAKAKSAQGKLRERLTYIISM
jgi:hypothetical protein